MRSEDAAMSIARDKGKARGAKNQLGQLGCKRQNETSDSFRWSTGSRQAASRIKASVANMDGAFAADVPELPWQPRLGGKNSSRYLLCHSRFRHYRHAKRLLGRNGLRAVFAVYECGELVFATSITAKSQRLTVLSKTTWRSERSQSQRDSLVTGSRLALSSLDARIGRVGTFRLFSCGDVASPDLLRLDTQSSLILSYFKLNKS